MLFIRKTIARLGIRVKIRVHETPCNSMFSCFQTRCCLPGRYLQDRYRVKIIIHKTPCNSMFLMHEYETESISSCGVSDSNVAYQTDSNDKNSRV